MIRGALMSNELILMLILQGAVMVVLVLYLGKPFAKLWATFMEAGRLSLIVVVDEGPNSNQAVKRHLLEIIKAAQQDIEMFDDGDDDADSIYQDPMIVAALKQKLATIPDFRVTCYLNEDNDLLFRREMEEWYPRAQVHAGIQPTARPEQQVHYKIADGGRLSYLSQHPRGEAERWFRRYDCTRLRKRDLRIEADRLFGPFQRSVAETYQHSVGQNQAIA